MTWLDPTVEWAREHGLRISYRRAGKYYVALLRDNDENVVWECGHFHRRREASSPTQLSAHDCSRHEIQQRQSRMGTLEHHPKCNPWCTSTSHYLQSTPPEVGS